MHSRHGSDPWGLAARVPPEARAGFRSPNESIGRCARLLFRDRFDGSVGFIIGIRAFFQ
jgi:hypothetical protein